MDCTPHLCPLIGMCVKLISYWLVWWLDYKFVLNFSHCKMSGQLSVWSFFKKPNNCNVVDKCGKKKRGIDTEENEGQAEGSEKDNVNAAANMELESSGNK